MASLLHTDFEKEAFPKLERYIKVKNDFDRLFTGRALSVLLVDGDDDFPLHEYRQSSEGITVKYFDLARATKGDCELIGKRINSYIADDGSCLIDGLIFDNVDRINTGDRDEDEYLEELVWQALKREDDYRIAQQGRPIPFPALMIAARCKEIPGYLEGRSMMAVTVDTSDTELY